jgi:hypothetical protein
MIVLYHIEITLEKVQIMSSVEDQWQRSRQEEKMQEKKNIINKINNLLWAGMLLLFAKGAIW